jgi:hypothetical protein
LQEGTASGTIIRILAPYNKDFRDECDLPG